MVLTLIFQDQFNSNKWHHWTSLWTSRDVKWPFRSKKVNSSWVSSDLPYMICYWCVISNRMSILHSLAVITAEKSQLLSLGQTFAPPTATLPPGDISQNWSWLFEYFLIYFVNDRLTHNSIAINSWRGVTILIVQSSITFDYLELIKITNETRSNSVPVDFGSLYGMQ